MPAPVTFLATFTPIRVSLSYRLSFKGFRKGRFFQKQLSDEVQLETKSKREKHSSKSKLAKIVVECPKEGIVHYLSGESMDGDGIQQWDKCKLVLVKTAGGFMLEFYSPPKVSGESESQIHLRRTSIWRLCSGSVRFNFILIPLFLSRFSR